MLVRVIETNHTLSPRMLFDRMDIFDVEFFQFLRECIKISFFKIDLSIIAAKGYLIGADKLFPCFKCLQT